MQPIVKQYIRYIASRILGPFVLITLSITCIIWLTQSLRFIDLIINRGLNIASFLYLSILLIPSLLSIAVPIALDAYALTPLQYSWISPGDSIWRDRTPYRTTPAR